MSGHSYRVFDVPVSGGDLRVAVWDPEDADPTTPTALLIHGVTSSHLAWRHVVAQLPGVRLIAPDLRGRGASHAVTGPAGMRAHADDLAAVLEAVGIAQLPVIGHSMGAFVAVVFANRYPLRVSRLVLVDGGLPLDVPAGLDADTLVASILGSTAERLSKRWNDAEEYTEAFWRHHPAFEGQWSQALEEYIAYDLIPDGDKFRAATSYATTVDDTLDMNTGSDLPDALANLRHPTMFVSVPRGLQNQVPGLYPPEHLDRVLQQFPQIHHVHLDDLNHYTVVMGADGAERLGPLLRNEVALAGVAR